MTEEMLEGLQRSISYRFGQVKLLTMALTHSSYANEMSMPHNERLEFLGDAVLELVVSDELFRRFPDSPEGVLTKLRARLVSMPSLAEVAKTLELERYLFLGRGEESQGGRSRDSLLSDAMEALMGAVFVDGGFEAARVVITGLLSKRWPKDAEPPKAKDYKSQLQEFTQRLHKARPVYRLAGSFGPEHDKRFEVELTLPDDSIVVSQGSSLKKAEQTAARKALEIFGES